MSLDLSSCEKSVYSQYGEDGVIEFILETLVNSSVPLSKIVCEFGAWDGKHLSNTRNLIDNHGYKGVLIESNAAKYESLIANSSPEQVIALNEMVLSEGNTLEAIFRKNSLDLKLDVLSIDIDGDDIHVLSSLNVMRPLVIVIEYNPSIPLNYEYCNPIGKSHGSSALAIMNVAKDLGYSLIHRTPVNLILVQERHLHCFNRDERKDLLEPRDFDLDIPKVFYGYDGTLMFTSDLKLPWHSIPIHFEDVQPLPRNLRTIPTNYNRFQRIQYFWKVFGLVALVKRFTLIILRKV